MVKLAHITVGTLLFAWAAAGAAVASPAFTADAVQNRPGQPPDTGRVFVSDQGTRFEFQRRGVTMVQIVLPAQGVMRVLNPQDKTFFEVQGAAPPPEANARPETPCPPAQVARCEKIGQEPVAGRAIDVWRITPKEIPGQPAAQGQVGKGAMQVWWDAQRRMSVKEQYPDGGSSQSVLRGTVNHQGRAVEHWETTVTSQAGASMRLVRWHDPELMTDVREEFPNGAVREFRNIRVVAPDAAWFAVPADYRRVEPPTGPRGAQGSPPANPTGAR